MTLRTCVRCGNHPSVQLFRGRCGAPGNGRSESVSSREAVLFVCQGMCDISPKNYCMSTAGFERAQRELQWCFS